LVELVLFNIYLIAVDSISCLRLMECASHKHDARNLYTCKSRAP